MLGRARCEKAIKIVERDVKKLKRRRIPLVKVRWNSRQGAEYTWEREDQFQKKYLHLFFEPVKRGSVVMDRAIGTGQPQLSWVTRFDHGDLRLRDQCEEEVTEAMGEPTMEEYMTKTREDYGSRIARPKIDEKAYFELKGQFIKELCDNTFSGSDNEDANEHIEKVLDIVDLFHIPNVTQDQIMFRVSPMLLTGAASRWLRNEPAVSIDTWETLKKKFLSKYCPPARTAKKMEEINNFQQEPDKTLYQA
ncbi:hypothetical protein Tco_0806058 [Tanacetum coccineum]